ncbi:unnamed protein product, partial [marine sediment metagenome]
MIKLNVIAMFNFYMPTRIVFGNGRFNETGSLVKELGNKALIVTGRSAMRRLGYTDRLVSMLQESDIQSIVFDKITPNPLVPQIDEGAKIARENNVDFTIGLGGGSAIDAAKSIAAVAAENHKTIQYLRGEVQPSEKTLPIVAIPTTAGTGS